MTEGNRLPGHAKASFGRQFNVDYDCLNLGHALHLESRANRKLTVAQSD
jgi:hypothetical protein